MKQTTKVLLSAVLTIAMCVSVISGATFALFTSEAQTNIAVTAGKVQMGASIDGIQTWSLENDKTVAGRTDGTFTQGGSATFENGTLTLDKIIPGDKVSFNITGANDSNVTVQYRVKIACADGYELMSALVVTVGTTEYKALSSYTSAWAKLNAETDMTPVEVSIELPKDAGNEYQGLTTKITVTVEAVQGNGLSQEDIATPVEVRYISVSEDDEDLLDAIEDPNVTTLYIKGNRTYDWGGASYDNSNALDLVGKTVIGADEDASITFKGYGSANPLKNVTFKNVTIIDETVGDNESSWEHGYLEFESLTAENVVFADGIMLSGDSTLTNCTVHNPIASWYGLWIEGGNTVIKDCSFTGTRAVKIHEAYSNDVASVVVDNCSFILSEKPGVVMGDLNASTSVTIKNSSFACQAGDQGKYIYESDTDVSTFTFSEANNTVIENATVATPENDDKLEDALTSNSEYIFVNLTGDVTYDVAAWANNGMGGASTETITIDGQGHTITFNQTDSDWNNIVTNGAKLIIKNAHITNSGHNDGPWNRHDLNFACDVELINVTSDKALAFKAGAILKNVTINDANTSDTYAIWIQPNGQTVDIDGLTVDMLDCTDGRGIKIDEQYVSSPVKVTLNVKNATFKTEEKSAILVKSVAGAGITLENVDISGVAADSTNAVWVDEASAGYENLVTVNGGSKIVEQ